MGENLENREKGFITCMGTQIRLRADISSKQSSPESYGIPYSKCSQKPLSTKNPVCKKLSCKKEGEINTFSSHLIR